MATSFSGIVLAQAVKEADLAAWEATGLLKVLYREGVFEQLPKTQASVGELLAKFDKAVDRAKAVKEALV